MFNLNRQSTIQTKHKCKEQQTDIYENEWLFESTSSAQFFSIVWNWFCCFFFKQSLEFFWICRKLILLVLFCIFHTDSLRALPCCSVSFSEGHRKSCLSVRKFSKWLLSCLLLPAFQAGRGHVFFPCHLKQGWGHRSQSHSGSDLSTKELPTLLWEYL